MAGGPGPAPATSGKSEGVNSLKEQAALLEKQLQDIKRKMERVAAGDKSGVASVNSRDCNGCGVCVDSCPVYAIVMNDVAHIDENICTGCGRCVDACPLHVISMK
jgi:Na+-translocating ferredoxin:NAD+ oxidoreductase RNF subunit RnfB